MDETSEGKIIGAMELWSNGLVSSNTPVLPYSICMNSC
jgi:hypothetical protein